MKQLLTRAELVALLTPLDEETEYGGIYRECEVYFEKIAMSYGLLYDRLRVLKNDAVLQDIRDCILIAIDYVKRKYSLSKNMETELARHLIEKYVFPDLVTRL